MYKFWNFVDVYYSDGRRHVKVCTHTRARRGAPSIFAGTVIFITNVSKIIISYNICVVKKQNREFLVLNCFFIILHK